MKQMLTYPLLGKENRIFKGTGGVSQENRGCGFVPAFYDSHSCQAVISRFANGKPAPIHVLDGLPKEWVTAPDKSGRAVGVKGSVIAGFMSQGKFYTRAQAARTIAGHCLSHFNQFLL